MNTPTPDPTLGATAAAWLLTFLRTPDDALTYEQGRLKRRLETILLNLARELAAIPIPDWLRAERPR